MNAQKIVDMGKDVLATITNGDSAKYARQRLTIAFAEMRDRTGAADAACRILDDLKAGNKVGKRDVGTKESTVMVAGIATTTTSKVYSDTTSNAKRCLVGAVNAAYKEYSDKVTLVSHKTGTTTFKLDEVKQVDKVEQAVDHLVSLLNITSVEEASLRHKVDSLIKAEAARVADAEKAREAARAAARLASEEQAKEQEAARLAAFAVKVSEVCASQGIKEGSKAWQAVEMALAM